MFLSAESLSTASGEQGNCLSCFPRSETILGTQQAFNKCFLKKNKPNIRQINITSYQHDDKKMRKKFICTVGGC